jgi:transcriptional regulator with XRE-family HTH domain
LYDEVFYDRVVKLRMKKGVSQREMSLSMGQSEGYMTKMESKVSLPSMRVFFYICEYLGVHPKDFFDEDINCPEAINSITKDLLKMNEEQLANVAAIIKDIVR